MRWVVMATVAVAYLLGHSTALADVQRFAVLVGNNRGSGKDEPLRYAELDAERMATLLKDLGGFHPANVVLLRDEDHDAFRSTLIALNDRIRQAQSLPDTQAVLFVYYSGHADAQALRLGRTRLPLRELAQLVRGSPATFRLLVVDACRSGSLTRLKGGKRVAPFALVTPALRGEGLAFLTATSVNEDAQESDDIRGSFFTHALVSGLLGAADVDGDGQVVLEEAYGYAYAATVRETSRTAAGSQHPSFHYDFRGQDAFVLTRLQPGSKRRGALRFPQNISFLVLGGGPQGDVVGEVGARDVARTLSVRPGRYFVRGRGADVLFEGEVIASAARTEDVRLASLDRVQYARLVRKGGSEARVAHGLELGAAGHSGLPNASTLCLGATLGYRAELPHFSVFGRVDACRARLESSELRATTDEIDVSAALLYAADVSFLTLGIGAGAGATTAVQRFETRGDAPTRTSLVPSVFALLNATAHLGPRFFLAADSRAEAHFIRFQETAREEPELRVGFALRLAVTGGAYF